MEIDNDMLTAVNSLETILKYRFNNKQLLEEAITHPSHTSTFSYQRLEFVGDAVLGIVFTNHVFLAYPGLDPGQLSLIRAANISTEKLARVAVKNQFYLYLRHNSPALEAKIKEFVHFVTDSQEVEDDDQYSVMKAPKVLADIVESIAAAVYVDCGYNLERLWLVFRVILEPIVTLETLEQQPVTSLYEHCQKLGKKVDFKHWRKGQKVFCNVFIDGRLVGAGCSEQKEIAKLNAARQSLLQLVSETPMEVEDDVVDGTEGSKQKLNELCLKNRWPKPTYRIENETGPSHERRFTCSVLVQTSDGTYMACGDEKSRVRDSENSAAFIILSDLRKMI